MEDQVGPWKQTVSGRIVEFLDPDPNEITLSDISHALWRYPRYGGHTWEEYNVALHSIWCSIASEALSPGDLDLKRAALIHDAAEAYVGDMISPLKSLLRRDTRAFDMVEEKLMDVIIDKYGISRDVAVWQKVKQIDTEALHLERERFVGPEVRPWGVPRDGVVSMMVREAGFSLDPKSWPRRDAVMKKEKLWRHRALQLGLSD